MSMNEISTKAVAQNNLNIIMKIVLLLLLFSFHLYNRQSSIRVVQIWKLMPMNGMHRTLVTATNTSLKIWMALLPLLLFSFHLLNHKRFANTIKFCKHSSRCHEWNWHNTCSSNIKLNIIKKMNVPLLLYVLFSFIKSP